MKTLLLSVIILIGVQIYSDAQSKIMDCAVSWNDSSGNYYGTLNIYLIDTIGIHGVNVNIGSQQDSSDIYSLHFNVPGLPSNAALHDNIVTVDLGAFSYHADYFVETKIVLDNADFHEIEIHSSN